jgi:uncharacterized repeat protein (TIGR03803 family)
MSTRTTFGNRLRPVPTPLLANWTACGLKSALTVCLIGGMSLATSAQSFYNLDFELATGIPASPNPLSVPFTQAFPGWTGYCGTNPQDFASYDVMALDSANISILDSSFWVPNGFTPPSGFLHGRFFVLIQSGHDLRYPIGPVVDTSIAQTGTVPSDATTLLVNAFNAIGAAELAVTFNRTPIPLVPVGGQSDYVVLSGNVSQFAGQSGELRFTMPFSWYTLPDGSQYPRYGPVFLDHIRFPGTLPQPDAPTILTSPQDQTIDVGSAVDFVVSAAGRPPLAYQWLFNGTNAISGATFRTLHLDNIQLSNAGIYSVVVSNAFGAATSSPAALNVIAPPPVILTQPSAQAALVGETVYFGVSARGSLPLSFQWLFNRSPITGAGDAYLQLTNVQLSQSGSYSVIVTNAFGAVTSSPALLTVTAGPPTIQMPPSSQTAQVGETVSFTATAAGSLPLGYQWFFNSSPISGAGSTALELSNLQLSQSGAYTIVVTNAFGAVTSAPAILIVLSGVSFTNLHDFCGTDGTWPQGGVLLATNTLYGAAAGNTGGTIFRINTDGTGFLRLFSFNGNNGRNPYGTLALGDETLYGTTAGGGTEDYGTIFRVKADGSDFATLFNFNETNGFTPTGGLALGGDTLFGTTGNGGAAGKGTVFRIRTDGSEFATLHSFNGGDGGFPYAALVLSGNRLYGTTVSGGNCDDGTVFTINTDGTEFTTLHHFAGSDGRVVYAGLFSSGHVLYGTASFGGASDNGTVFKINADGTDFATIYSFHANDGYCPFGTPVLAGGTLYGTLSSGGTGAEGALFSVNINGTAFTRLHGFQPSVSGVNSDGAVPWEGLVVSAGVLYGTAVQGGSCGGGTVFALPLPLLVTPLSQTAELGNAATFRLGLAGANPRTCQWAFNGTNLLVNATNALLRLEHLQFDQVGAYSVFATSAFGTLTSAAAVLNVIPSVERRWVPGIGLAGQAGMPFNLEYADAVQPEPNWLPLGAVTLASTSQFCLDLSMPLPPQRFYRAWQTGVPSAPPGLDLHMVPAITLAGAIGSSVHLDYINQFGPIDAWSTLATVVLTNTSQLYFDTSTIGRPPRLYRLVPVP